MDIICRACAEAVPRRRSHGKRRPAYWWTNEIADLRRTCKRLRRAAQRAQARHHDVGPPAAEHLAAKKQLKRAIKSSKRRCWRKLTEDLNNDPWGLGYKIVARKLGAFAQSSPKDAATIDNIVSTLFPTHPKRPGTSVPSGDTEIPLFTEAELSKAASSMRNKRAPGPDGLPAELFKAIAKSHPCLLLSMYNACLEAGIFPKRWKIARLVLISKGKGPADAPASYRPLCMLDTAGKLLEKLLKPRLLEAVRDAGDLAPRQHGFRQGRSTIEAVQEVVNAAWATEVGNHFSRPVCLLATLDVKNAFNSVRWDEALAAMEREFRIPRYLSRIIGDYLKDRFLVYDTEDGPKKKELTSGAAQGSILGPEIWNISYDGILRLELPEGAFLVGYADDLAAVIVARDMELVQLRLNQVMLRVGFWMRDRGLELAEAKTEIVLLTKKRIETLRVMQVGNAAVQTKATAKYLGVTLDTKLNFGEHLIRAADRAAAVTTALNRVMANINGPRPCKRRLLMRTAESIMLYGAEVWADALNRETHRKRVAAVQRRGALRIACSYRTVSEPAVLVVAGVIPIDLLAQERKFVHQMKNALGRRQAHLQARANSLSIWEQRWHSDPRGRWTARLIPRLDVWVNRSHGEVNYYLTQFLTGHGLFRSYLYKMGKVADGGCVLCNAQKDDALHTFFLCQRWTEERRRAEAILGALTPDNIVGLMLRGTTEWLAVDGLVRAILRLKKEALDGLARRRL